MKQHFARTESLHQDDWQLAAVAHPSGVLDEDRGTGFDTRCVDHPVKARQAFPDGVAVLLVRVESEDRRTLSPLDRQLRTNLVWQGNVGRGDFNAVQFDRQQRFERGAAVLHRVVLSPGDHDEAAARVAHKIAKRLQRARRQVLRIEITQNDDVISVELFRVDRQPPSQRSRRDILIGVFKVCFLQDRVQIDRLLTFEQRLEFAELPAWFEVGQQNADATFANADLSDLGIVGFVRLAALGNGFENELVFAGLFGDPLDLNRQRLPILSRGDLLSSQGLAAAFATQLDRDFLPFEARASELAGKRDRVSDKRNVVNEHVEQVEIEHRLFAADADCVDRNEPLGGGLGHDGQSVRVGRARDAVGQNYNRGRE